MPPHSPKTLPPGTLLGPYRVVSLLGAGAYGAVYEVVHAIVGKRMALKVLHRAMRDHEEVRLRFDREAQVAGTIEHPNIVQVFDIGEDGPHRYMAMELLEGETLEARIARGAPMSLREVADLFVPIASALAALHDRGVVHRDLKPGNIFLAARRGQSVVPKLLDFGVVKDADGAFGGELTRTDAMVGSPAYMSPEQVQQSRAIDARSDQFALAAIVWECLIGRRLFEATSLYEVLSRIAGDPIANPASLRADVPPALDALVMRALERDPARRFESVREIGRGLLAYGADATRAAWRDEHRDEDRLDAGHTRTVPMSPSARPGERPASAEAPVDASLTPTTRVVPSSRVRRMRHLVFAAAIAFAALLADVTWTLGRRGQRQGHAQDASIPPAVPIAPRVTEREPPRDDDTRTAHGRDDPDAAVVTPAQPAPSARPADARRRARGVNI